MKNKIIVINGPNLNLLGEREKKKYGNVSLKDIENTCVKYGSENNLEISFKQSNIEGEIVDLVQKSRTLYSGLIINAAGYTHTSVAILVALKVLTIPIESTESTSPPSSLLEKGNLPGESPVPPVDQGFLVPAFPVAGNTFSLLEPMHGYWFLGYKS